MLICGVVVSFYICNLNHIFFPDECTKQFKQFHLHDNNVFYQRHDDNNNIFNYQQPIYTPNPTSIFSKFHSIKHNTTQTNIFCFWKSELTTLTFFGSKPTVFRPVPNFQLQTATNYFYNNQFDEDLSQSFRSKSFQQPWRLTWSPWPPQYTF